MKRIFTILCAAALVCAAASCGTPAQVQETSITAAPMATAETQPQNDNIDSDIALLQQQIASGDYESATAKIAELNSKNLNAYQKKQVEELNQTLISAQAKSIAADSIKNSEDAAQKAQEQAQKAQEQARKAEAAAQKAQAQASSVQTSSNTTVVDTYYVVNCNEYITLRATPSTSGKDLAHIPLGASVGYIEQAANGFYKISYNGQIGYSLSSYLTDEERGAPMTATVVNCNEYITLRATPSTKGKDLAHMPLGAVAMFVSTAENGFYCVEYNGQRGYALQSYLKVE